MKLKGKTQKGKNRIRELGDIWVQMVGEVRDRVEFDSRPGPWLALAPVDNSQAWRWVHATDDKDFEIVK